jgi:phosphohistidine phosphatase
MARRGHRVYLVRHGKAEGDHPDGDAARRLTAEGRARLADLLEDLGEELRISRVLTSPLVRARQTAGLLVAATGAPLADEPSLGSGRSTGRELLALAGRAGEGAALVGHNPEMAEAISVAAGRAEEVKPGTVAAIDLTPSGPRLAWLKRP